MDADPWADAPVAGTSTKRTSLEVAETSTNPPVSVSKENSGSVDPNNGGFDDDPGPPLPADKLDMAGVPGEDAEDAADDFGDDFDDFDAAPIAAAGGSGGVEDGAGEDAFGDFGDFEEGDFDAVQTETAPSVRDLTTPIPEERLPTLQLRPFPSPNSLISQLTTLFSPLLDPSSSSFTDEPPRIASSSRQILPTDTARDLYIQLASPPQLKPLDWTRSRVRREHLIHMGIPVNLDEVDSHLLTKLPALTISTNFDDLRRTRPRDRKSEEAEVRRSEDGRKKGKGRETESMPGSAMPRETGGDVKYGLGSRPELDVQKAEELCGIEEDQISILSPAALAKIQDELVQSSAQASALLAHLLQLKDAQSHDAATYNGMISNLITNAANARSAQATSGGVFRRTSVRRPVSTIGNGTGGSGSVTPRTGSPAMR